MGSSHQASAYRCLVSPQAFTGVVPFDNITTAAATFAIMRGKRPPRPTHPDLTEQLWTLIQCCWYQNPYSRPEVSRVSKVLSGE